MKGKIFNAQEVQAMLNGSKVMFREIAKIKLSIASYNFDTKQFYDDPIFKKCPYQVGQKIFCKESWNAFSGETLGTPLGKMRLYSYPPKQGDIITYKADADLTKDFTSYLSSRTMPQWASRLTLLIKEIRVEKLIPITQEDCVAEGVKFGYKETNWGATKAFKDNWNANHKKPEEKFEVNPFCWVVDFKINN